MSSPNEYSSNSFYSLHGSVNYSEETPLEYSLPEIPESLHSLESFPNLKFSTTHDLEINIEDKICVPPVLAKSSSITINLATIGELKCGLYCQNAYKDMYFSKDQQYITELIQIITCTIGLVLSILLCIHLVCIHRYKSTQKLKFNVRRVMAQSPPITPIKVLRSHLPSIETSNDGDSVTQNAIFSLSPKKDAIMKSKSTKSIRSVHFPAKNSITTPDPNRRVSYIANIHTKHQKQKGFTYQIPFVINSAYIIFMICYLLQHIIGSDKLMCNPNEMTIANPNQGNLMCTINGLLWTSCLYIIILYIIGLSVALFTTLHYPLRGLLESWQSHVFLLAIIVVNGIYLVGTNSIAAGSFGTCSASRGITMDKQGHTVLYYYLIPSVCGAVITPIFLVMNAMKLRQMSSAEVMCVVCFLLYFVCC